MKKIESQALDVLTKALGLSGAGSPVTELSDGVVDQVLDVASIVRRSRTQGKTTGIYTALLRNIHAGAESKSSLLKPYAPSSGTPRAPYPNPMPAGFDVWLLTAAVTQLSGSGTLSAQLRLDIPPTQMGISITGTSVEARMTVANWDAVIAENTTFGVASAVDKPLWRIGTRIPRSADTDIVFASTSSAIATFDCFMTIGVFPVGLGQDIVC